MGFFKPTPPPYDPLAWRQMPFAERARRSCEAWAVQGYGAPLYVLLIYVFKVGFYIAGWVYFCSFGPGHGEEWWFHPVAFQKAILWSMFFEGLGLGCGSGPLTARYFPPIGGFLYFLRPGTTKSSLFPSIFGIKRNAFDCLLYLAHNVFLVRALIAPEPTFELLLPLVIILPILGVMDQTLFLVARGEHYYTTIVCFAFAGNWIAAAKVVHLALWFWAGVSKLNHHFPAVVCVMTSNSPMTSAVPWFRKLMYRRYPEDLRPSKLAEVMAHLGSALEFAVPIVLLFASGGTQTTIGLVLMVVLHAFITSNLPMGVPIEWNFMMVYGGFFLFGQHANVSVLEVGSPLIAAFLIIWAILIPLAGNLFPSRISFLLAMRYYAGNWAFSMWLFKGESYRKLDRHLKKSSGWIYDQLSKFYDLSTSVGLVSKVLAFRSMHLHGRMLQRLVPKAVDRPEDYEPVEGELVAGMVLGWNFGDGHLHDERLLAAVQAQCGFEDGELRCIFVEAQPLFGSTMSYRIADAKRGVIERGEVPVKELREVQPWKA